MVDTSKADLERFRQRLPGWMRRSPKTRTSAPQPSNQSDSPHQRREGDRIAFVMAGGGGRGAAQVGMLGAACEAGLIPDVVVGVSVGALNGAAFAAQPDLASIRQLDALWRTMRKESIFPGSRFSTRFRYAQKTESVFPSSPLKSLISGNMSIEDISLTQIPVHVLATDYHTGEELWFNSGAPRDVLYATAALPGVLPPYQYEGRHLIDGGVVNDVPISKAIELGANKIYIFLCGTASATLPDPKRPIEAMLRSYHLTKLARLRSDLASAPVGITLHVIESPVAANMDALDFDHTAALIEDGYHSAAKLLGIEPQSMPDWVTASSLSPDTPGLSDQPSGVDSVSPVNSISSLARLTKNPKLRSQWMSPSRRITVAVVPDESRSSA